MELGATIREFRQFNRFYTRLIGLFNKQLLGSPLTLAQARVLWEVAAAPGVSSADLARSLGMDRGQLSRVVKQLLDQELITRPSGNAGRRAVPLHPTDKGRKLLARIETAADEQAACLLRELDAGKRQRLRHALRDVESVFSGKSSADLTVRPARAGELGWIATRHAQLYATTDGFDEHFEHYVLLGLAVYLKKDRSRSNVWVAELGGEPVGSIGIVESDDPSSAQMRWLLVEPHTRGKGVGRALVAHALDFSRNKDYENVFLWTLGHLAPARTLYQSLGFELTETKHSEMGGRKVVEERWVMRCSDPAV